MFVESQTELRRIRDDIDNFRLNFWGLKADIREIRHIDIPNAESNLEELRNSDTATPEEIREAARNLAELRSDLAGTIAAKEEERTLIQCLRICLQNFHRNSRSVPLLLDCEEACTDI